MQYTAKRLTKKVFEIIKEDWPIHASGICRYLELELTPSNISKIKYHLGILKKKQKIRTKKIDRALVVWPIQIEKLRVMHEFLGKI